MTSARKNLTQPADWWAAFEKQAKADGMTLSEWVGHWCTSGISPRARKRLSDRPPANRPKRSRAAKGRNG